MRRLRDGMPTVLVSLHSFTPVYAGIARPWHIGTLYHRDTSLPPLLLKLLRGEGDLVVGDNEPYAVSDETDYTIPVHGEARGLMNTGIEIRQDLIADQAGSRMGNGWRGFWRDRDHPARAGLSGDDRLSGVGRFASRSQGRGSSIALAPERALTAPASAPARCRRRS